MKMIEKNAGFAKKFRRVVFAFFAMASGFSCFAFDFGALVKNDSALEDCGKNDFKLNQKNSASVWVRAPFEKSGENHFAAEFVYNFEADLQNENYKNALDFNLFELSFSREISSSTLGLQFGRFYFSDLTGKIFSQNADGLMFGLKNRWVKLSAYASYTGLLNALNTEMITSAPSTFLYSAGNSGNETPGIENGLYSFNADYDKIYDFAEKYLAADLALSFPNLFEGQTLSAEFLAAFRLEGDDFNRMYATFSMEGPVASSFFYDVSSTLGFVDYDGKVKISNLSEIQLEYYLKNFSFCADALYASGEQGGLSAFAGFTKNVSTCSAQKFLYSGILKTGLSCSYKPFETLLFSAGSDVVFNAAAGDKKEDIEYFGFQYSLGAVFQVKSDFQLGFSASQFIDKDNSENIKKTCFDLKAVLAF